MSCFEYQELISGYVDNEISKKELKGLLIHLEVCQSCKKNLRDLILQKEKLLSLRSLPSDPIPALNFAQTVIEKISQDEREHKTKEPRFNLPHFINWLVFPIRNPLYAGVVSFLVLIGVLIGAFLENLITHGEQKELLSVYELQDKKTFQGTAQLARLEDEKKTIVFHHIASSSNETFANEPSLLKYTAYTTPTDN